MTTAKTVTSENLTPEQLDTLLEEMSEQGFDQNSYGLYLIHSAENNNLAHVRIMLSLNADVNTTDAHGNTALIWASYYGHTDIVRLLVTVENINLDYVDHEGCSALYWAEKKQHTECAEILRQAGAHCIQRAPKINEQSALEEATTRLQVMGIWPNSYNSAICNATDKGDNSVLRYLITAGADVNSVAEDGFTPLTNVCLQGNTDGMLLLLDAPGIDINRKNGNGDTALICAAAQGKTDCLLLLLDTPGIDINQVDRERKTATERASENNQVVCELLLKAVNINSHDNRLSYNADIARDILQRLGIRAENYNQLICAATDKKENWLLRLLIAAGADVNAVGEDGWTPLANCCLNDNIVGVRILLAEPGIDVNKAISGVPSPIEIATNRSHTEIVRLLNEAGATAAE